MKWLLRSILLVALVGVSCSTTTNSPVSYSQNSLAPTITRFSPDTVWTFKTLTIYGTNFGYDANDIRVFIDTVPVSITDVEDTMVTAKVPEGARTGLVRVWAYEQTAMSTKPVAVDYTFNPHPVNDTVAEGGSFSIPGIGMNHARGYLRLSVNGGNIPVDSVFPNRVVCHATPNCSSTPIWLVDSDGMHSCGTLYVTRTSAWGTLSEIWNRLTLTETHHRTGYVNGPSHSIDSTWTVKVYWDGQRDWNVHGGKFVRMSSQLIYDSPPFSINWDTVRQIAVVSLQQHSHTTMGGHTFDTTWTAGDNNYLPAPLPVDGEFEFVLPNFQYQIQETFTDGQGLANWQEITNTQLTSGEFDIILKH